MARLCPETSTVLGLWKTLDRRPLTGTFPTFTFAAFHGKTFCFFWSKKKARQTPISGSRFSHLPGGHCPPGCPSASTFYLPPTLLYVARDALKVTY